MKRYLVLYSFCFFLVVGLQAQQKLVILHTNDTHSQIEPTAPNAGKNADMGGYARRLGVINQIRAEEEHVVLVDAGDFSQGTPYYNFFSGRLEVMGYNLMQYDAVTLGNHEFDNGMDSLAAILKLATFPIVSSNYETKGSLIHAFVKPYVVVKSGNLRIGIMGLGIEPAGLIMENHYQGIVFKDPLETAKRISEHLKKKERCDVVICLSHLGYNPESDKMNDIVIASETNYIDVIVGGHSHTMLENEKVSNLEGRPVVIAQMGRSGLYLGRIDLVLSPVKP